MPTAQYSTLAFIAGAMALVLTLAADIHPVVAAAFALLPVAALMALHPKWLTVMTVLSLVILEEFPWGLGESGERSIRTPFYATSLGIPGVYPPDLLVFGAIFLLITRIILTRRQFLLPNDKIQVALIMITGLLILSAVLSMADGNPFHANMAANTATAYKVNEKGAELIALFQFKNFAFLIFAYVLGLLYFETEQDAERLLMALFLAVAVIVLMGFMRILMKPSIIPEAKPLFYHSPSSWIFALAIFYWIIQWLTGNTSEGQFLIRLAMTACLGLFILISYRRTMWGGIALCMFALIPLLPGIIRKRYLILLSIALGLMACLVVAIPPLLNAVLARLLETSAADPSTLYRLSLFVWFSQNLADLPLLGYGVRPLWDISASLGYFRTNLENIHSLYFWVLLRVGLIGFLAFAVSLFLIALQIIQSIRRQQGQRYFAICTVIALALIMLLFSGIFNPVYAEIRYVVLIGFAFAFISRLPLMTGEFNAARV